MLWGYGNRFSRWDLGLKVQLWAGGGVVVKKMVLSGAIQRTSKDRRETAGLAVRDDVGIASRKPNLLVYRKPPTLNLYL